MGNFCNFTPTKNKTNQNFEKMKKMLDISFYTCVQKPQSFEVPFLRYGVRDKIFC